MSEVREPGRIHKALEAIREKLRSAAPWRPERSALFAEQLRGGIHLVLGIIVAFTVLDVFIGRTNAAVNWLRVADTVLLLAALAVLRDPERSRRAIPIAILCVVSIGMTTSASGVVRGEDLNTTLLNLLLLLAASALLPWGVRAQLAASIVTTIAIGWNVLMVSGSLSAFGYSMVITTFTGIATSVFIAHALGRSRATIAEREDALRASEERLRSVMANVPAYIVMVDRDGRIQFLNRDESLPGPAVGRTIFEYASPSHADGIGRAIETVFRTGEPLTLVSPAMADGRQIRWFRTRLGPIRRGEEIIAATMVASDVTDEREAAEAIRRAKETAELADRAKGEFLANMSHEIRTPLNAVIGMSDMLLDTKLSPEQRDFAETLRASSAALLSIINDVLDYSKIESGRVDLEREPFEIRACVEGAMDLVALEASTKGLEIAFAIEDDVPAWVVGDVTRVRQALLNLLSNAVKFTDVGEIVVTVAARRFGQGEHEIHFAVRDTGIGIPPDRIAGIFESYRQLDASTARKYGGTGLGLAISRRFAELMGGRMWVESVVDSGSTFHFTVLAAEASEKSRAALPNVKPLARKRVLVVDDNETNRLILSRKLGSWSMEARATGSPAEALAWVRTGEPFDLAILDFRMPDLDGVDLGTAMRDLRSERDLPLILLGSMRPISEGTEGDESSEASRLRIFSAILTKPAKPAQLFEAVLHACIGDRPPSSDDQPSLAKASGDAAGSLRILLAEDNRLNQKVALKLLGRLGYQADVAENGCEVLRALEQQPYDVIFMDLQMPEMDGLEATRQVRARWPSERQPRIIAMTANALQRDRERCFRAGMDDFLSKPVSGADLREALERCRRPELRTHEAR